MQCCQAYAAKSPQMWESQSIDIESLSEQIHGSKLRDALTCMSFFVMMLASYHHYYYYKSDVQVRQLRSIRRIMLASISWYEFMSVVPGFMSVVHGPYLAIVRARSGPLALEGCQLIHSDVPCLQRGRRLAMRSGSLYILAWFMWCLSPWSGKRELNFGALPTIGILITLQNVMVLSLDYLIDMAFYACWARMVFCI